MNVSKLTPNDRPYSRTLPLTCKVSSNDLDKIQAKVKETGKSLSQFLRDSALCAKVVPAQAIPGINEDQWQELSRVASNLNQLTFLCHTQEQTPLSKEVISSLAETGNILHEVRQALLGKPIQVKGGDNGSQN